MRKLTFSLLSLLAFLPAMGQERLGDVDAEEPEVRRYTVEVIIFRYAQNVSSGNEIFPRDVAPPEVQPFGGDRLPQGANRRTAPRPDRELVLLNAEDFQLGEIKSRMRRLGAYEPIMHFGWTQATWPQEQTEAMPLRRLARPPAGLDGDLTLYLNRFLHLVVDLQLEAPKTKALNVDEQERLGATRTVGELLDEVNAQPSVYYRIQEDRILKNGELRYYDHPKFGVLAKITRVEEQENSGATELLGYGTE